MTKPDLATELKNVSEQDRKQIEQAQEMLGPDPDTLGVVKSTFWGNFREDLLFPYPEQDPEQSARCDQLLAELDDYLTNEHPAHEIDRNQKIPEWVIKRLFQMGVLGMTIPTEYGGLGMGITSYNRVLERIGRSCGSTAVLVSAHQSIGCKALMLFGSPEQKQRYLTRMATDTLSAFCLSEPNVGCDAGGQETRCELSEDGSHYIINGEKKWATSGALSGLFTVMCKQPMADPRTGKISDRVTALICTPDMEGIDIFSRNRSKCGIRGTWQARIRFKNVRVPVENLLHKEGKGLNVALTCLNYGRCTLSAGMLGGARYAMEQGIKWSEYRYQFDRPIGEFDLIKQKLSRMAGYVYAMDAILYMTTGFLDRHDEDIMLETAMCKVFCSEMGFRTVNDCVQIMGGESCMTENDIERIWRDSRINIIVEGANEVMQSFIFAYGSKQLGEWMLSIKSSPLKQPVTALKIAMELYLGWRRSMPTFSRTHQRLRPLANELMMRIREHSHQVKLMFKEHEESLISNQFIQARLADNAMWIHAVSCVLSRADANIRDGLEGEALEDELAIVTGFCKMASREIARGTLELHHNDDGITRDSAAAATRRNSSLPNSNYAIPERTLDEEARGTGKIVDQEQIQQFGSGSKYEHALEQNKR